jgi:AcrR family transcriptional regulator
MNNKEKKQMILKTAEKLFNRFGIKKTAIDDIAALARVAKGTIYNNFGSKDGVLFEVLKQKIDAFEKGIETALLGIQDPVDELKIVLLERIRLIQNTPLISESIVAGDDMSLRSLYNELDRRLRLFIDRILQKDVPVALAAGERSKIIDSLIYLLRGIEASLRDSLTPQRPETIEQNIDYLIRRMIPHSGLK